MSGYGVAFPSSHAFSSWTLVPSSHCEGQRMPWGPCIPQSCGNTAARHLCCEYGYGDLLSCACHRPSRQLPPTDQEPDEDASCAAPDALPEVHRLIVIPFFRCKDICDVPDALRPAQEQIYRPRSGLPVIQCPDAHRWLHAQQGRQTAHGKEQMHG